MAEEATTSVELPARRRRPPEHPPAPTRTPLHLRVRDGLRRTHNWIQLIRFGIVGGTGYVVNLAVFALCVHLIGADDRLGGLGAQQLLAQPPLDVPRQARAPGAPGRSLLHHLAAGVRLQLPGADRTGGGGGHDEGAGAGDRRRRGHAAELRRAEALELPRLARGLAALAPARRLATLPLVALAPLAAALLSAPAAAAAARTVTVSVPGTPVLITTPNRPPAGYRLTASQVERIAARNP